MKLFIANTTKHHQEFAYRIPEYTRIFQQRISPGEQVLIYQDSPRDVLEYIINQHNDTPKPFLIPEDEAAKTQDFIGLIYSFDKPVSAVKIEDQFEKNDDALEAQGLEQRKEAAAALNQIVEQNAQEAGAGVNALEMTVVEETKKGDQSGGDKLNETISVSKSGGGKGGKGGK